MFTGVIQEIGKVRSAAISKGNMVLDIEATKISDKLNIGTSVSINGACQTVVTYDKEHFKVEAVQETLNRTNLADLKSGSHVNLELPLGISDLLHGHLVQGHVDCQSVISEIRSLDGSTLLIINYPRLYEKYLIEKGSIAIDGVSLTITAVTSESFTVSLIPHTLNNTIFHFRKVGDKVNLEFDLIAKYIEKLVSPHENAITLDFLREHGF